MCVCVYTCACVNLYTRCACIFWKRPKGVRSSGSRVPAVVNLLMWVLGTDLRSSGRAVSVRYAISCLVFSPVLSLASILQNPSPLSLTDNFFSI